jgi:hypothetical protein
MMFIAVEVERRAPNRPQDGPTPFRATLRRGQTVTHRPMRNRQIGAMSGGRETILKQL